jgi:fused signal recognition particle receptor
MTEDKNPGYFGRLFGIGGDKPKPAEPTPPAKKEPPSRETPREPPAGDPEQKEPPKDRPAKKEPPKDRPVKEAESAKPTPKGPPPQAPNPEPGEYPGEPEPQKKPAPPPAGPSTEPGATPPEELSPNEREKEESKPKPPTAAAPKQGWFAQLRQSLSRSSSTLSDNIASVLVRHKLNEETLDELEEVLIKADLGVAMAGRIRDALAKSRFDKGLTREALGDVLAAEIAEVLRPVAKPLAIAPEATPHVVLVVGVNGTGKTTTIGKLAHLFARQGHKVMLAAADTFRAAAIDQLKVWGERTVAEVISRDVGSDPAGVAFEALETARATGTDVLLIDTAGRLQNKTDLMGELAKIVRVLKKLDDSAPHSVLLVLDATTGQNALAQVQIFQEIAGVTGLVVTKLDGTARGGILVAIAERFKLPINAIGIGEGIDDLKPFDADDFAAALAGVSRENEATA